MNDFENLDLDGLISRLRHARQRNAHLGEPRDCDGFNADLGGNKLFLIVVDLPDGWPGQQLPEPTSAKARSIKQALQSRPAPSPSPPPSPSDDPVIRKLFE